MMEPTQMRSLQPISWTEERDLGRHLFCPGFKVLKMFVQLNKGKKGVATGLRTVTESPGARGVAAVAYLNCL